MRKTNVEIVKLYSEKPAVIFGNAGKLQQVFTNLILNARDAMLGGGKITLKTHANGNNQVDIAVADTGEGISAENLNKIFDPFFTTKGVGNGTGLGLAVSYGIVQEHGGTIEAQSGDRGTTFLLSFPAINRQRQRAVS
jgi:signal transduction histidine kinase